MLKKEKPMMTVAAIIEQAQNRWMEHPLMYNRGLQFQGSYCKYYLLLFIVYITINFDFSLSASPFLCIHTRIKIYLMEKSELFLWRSAGTIDSHHHLRHWRPNRLQPSHCCFYNFFTARFFELAFPFFLRAERMFVCVNLMNEKKCELLIQL